MKKLLLLFISTAMISTIVLAQDQKTTQNPKDPKQDRIEWEKKLKAELKLTDEQTIKFDALNKEYNDKIDALMQDASLDPNAQKEKKMSLKKEKETKLFEFLTPEQQTTYKTLVEKKKKETEPKS